MEVLEWFFVHRSEHSLTMKSLYQEVGISRQGFQQFRRRQVQETALAQQIINRVKALRKDHPRMGARPLYVLMQDKEQDSQLIKQIGRDQFEQILLSNGLRVRPIRIFRKTTYPGPGRFPNLVEGVEIKELNRIWISDLTYYQLTAGWAYLTFILELYSRRCLGYALSTNMTTEETTLKALKMALNNRNIPDYQQRLIFHSDGGGQYYDQHFLHLLKDYRIQSSMAGSVYENPHMERFHSTAKNDYLIPWGVRSICQLKKRLPDFVKLYNQQRPHQSLKQLSPIDFEKKLQHIPKDNRITTTFKKLS